MWKIRPTSRAWLRKGASPCPTVQLFCPTTENQPQRSTGGTPSRSKTQLAIKNKILDSRREKPRRQWWMKTRNTTPRVTGGEKLRPNTRRTRIGTSSPMKSTKSSASSKKRENQASSPKSSSRSSRIPLNTVSRDTTSIRVCSRTSSDITLTRKV